jgi:hypothetical protein
VNVSCSLRGNIVMCKFRGTGGNVEVVWSDALIWGKIWMESLFGWRFLQWQLKPVDNQGHQWMAPHLHSAQSTCNVRLVDSCNHCASPFFEHCVPVRCAFWDDLEWVISWGLCSSLPFGNQTWPLNTHTYIYTHTYKWVFDGNYHSFSWKIH